MPHFKYLTILGLALLLFSACTGGPEIIKEVTLPVSSTPTLTGLNEITDHESLPTQVAINYCLDCHSDKQNLIDTAVSPRAGDPKGIVWAGDLPELEPWEKVFVDAKNFIPTVHGRFPCTSCHGGIQSGDKETAHTGLIQNPSQGPEVVCSQCHPDVADVFQNSLHATVQGFWTAVVARSTPRNYTALKEAVRDNCISCHNTCGDCHVSQPKSVGGGLLDGHLFQRTPPMGLSCNSCHGSLVGAEFLGQNQDLPADVHYRLGNMDCLDCHTGNELHGQPANCNTCHPGPESANIPPPDHRYNGVQAPRCESCHTVVSTGQDDIIMHQMHGADLSCQVCHSIAYMNCEGCHISKDETGSPIIQLDGKQLGFLIGRNPIQTYERPYRFVPVRHAPISEDSFNSYGEGLLPNFDQLETWKYATPHNIQRNTPQTESCNVCHGNPDLFLTADKVAPDELNANQEVLVDQIPPLITSTEQIP